MVEFSSFVLASCNSSRYSSNTRTNLMFCAVLNIHRYLLSFVFHPVKLRFIFATLSNIIVDGTMEGRLRRYPGSDFAGFYSSRLYQGSVFILLIQDCVLCCFIAMVYQPKNHRYRHTVPVVTCQLPERAKSVKSVFVFLCSFLHGCRIAHAGVPVKLDLTCFSLDFL